MSPPFEVWVVAIVLFLAAVATYLCVIFKKHRPPPPDTLTWYPGLPGEDGSYWMRNPHIGDEMWPCEVSHGVPDCHLATVDGTLWAVREET